MGVHTKIIDGKLEFTGVNVPIEFIAKNIKKAPQFVRTCLKERIGLFANIGIIIKHDYRSIYYISDKEVFETFGLKYIEN